MGQLGDMLYAARQDAGVSLAEISNATRIRMSLLEALEQGDWDALPNPGYLRGFIADYSAYIGADAQPFLEQLESETGVTRLGQERPRSRRETRPSISTRHRRHEVNSRSLFIVGGALLLAGAAVWLAVTLWPDRSPVTPAPVSPGDTSTNSTDTTSATPAEGAPFTLEISITDGGASDVRVVVDGLVAFDGARTSANEPLKYDVVASAEITLSNPDKVVVFQNGTAVPVSVNPDTPFTLTAPPAE